jgi:hypothetical protein
MWIRVGTIQTNITLGRAIGEETSHVACESFNDTISRPQIWDLYLGRRKGMGIRPVGNDIEGQDWGEKIKWPSR